MLQQVSINLSRKFTETLDEVFEKLPFSPGDDLEEADTLKETEHETGDVATSVEFVKTPLDAIVALQIEPSILPIKDVKKPLLMTSLMKLLKMLPKLNN